MANVRALNKSPQWIWSCRQNNSKKGFHDVLKSLLAFAFLLQVLDLKKTKCLSVRVTDHLWRHIPSPKVSKLSSLQCLQLAEFLKKQTLVSVLSHGVQFVGHNWIHSFRSFLRLRNTPNAIPSGKDHACNASVFLGSAVCTRAGLAHGKFKNQPKKPPSSSPLLSARVIFAQALRSLSETCSWISACFFHWAVLSRSSAHASCTFFSTRDCASA